MAKYPVDFYVERDGPCQWMVRSRLGGVVRDEAGPLWTETIATTIAHLLTHHFHTAFDLGRAAAENDAALRQPPGVLASRVKTTPRTGKR